MAMILLGKHASQERPGSSLHSLFSGIEQVLTAKYDVLHTPDSASWAERSMSDWLGQHAWNADLLVGGDFRIVKMLRIAGWKGRVLHLALGDFPRGATGLRSVLPFLNRTDVIWCSSVADKQIYETLVDQDGYQPKAVVLPFGTDCNAYAPIPSIDKQDLRRTWQNMYRESGIRYMIPSIDKQDLRRTWGIAPEDFVVVYAGRITIEKNLHCVLDALAHLSGMGARLKIIIAGEFDNTPFREFNMWITGLEATIHRLIKRLNLSAHVRFVSWLDRARLNELYNVGDVFVNLTLNHDENFGFAQVEAMSAGLPIVATAWGGLKDVVVEGRAGFLSDTWVSDYGIRLDMPKVIYALRLLMGRPDLRKKIEVNPGSWTGREPRGIPAVTRQGGDDERRSSALQPAVQARGGAGTAHGAEERGADRA